MIFSISNSREVFRWRFYRFCKALSNFGEQLKSIIKSERFDESPTDENCSLAVLAGARVGERDEARTTEKFYG
jgi:hypothetical protein